VCKIKKLCVVSVGVLTLGSFAQASMLDQLIYNVAGQATNAAGARLGDEIYYGSSRSSSTHRTHKRKASAKRVTRVARMTDERRIQKALAGLGFYHGNIDGQVNSFETRSAIKDLNVAYGISTSASMGPEERDTLVYLGTLFIFDRYLISNNNNTRSKNKKIQVALKIHGYYHGAIDGAIGRGTRGSIGQYKMDNGMSGGNALNYEEEYQMISSAKQKNDKNLDDAINSLRSLGPRKIQQQSQPAQQAYVPKVPNTNVVPQQSPAPVRQVVAPAQQVQPMQHTQVVAPAQAPTQVVQPSAVQNTSDTASLEMYTDEK